MNIRYVCHLLPTYLELKIWSQKARVLGATGQYRGNRSMDLLQKLCEAYFARKIIPLQSLLGPREASCSYIPLYRLLPPSH